MSSPAHTIISLFKVLTNEVSLLALLGILLLQFAAAVAATERAAMTCWGPIKRFASIFVAALFPVLFCQLFLLAQKAVLERLIAISLFILYGFALITAAGALLITRRRIITVASQRTVRLRFFLLALMTFFSPLLVIGFLIIGLIVRILMPFRKRRPGKYNQLVSRKSMRHQQRITLHDCHFLAKKKLYVTTNRCYLDPFNPAHWFLKPIAEVDNYHVFTHVWNVKEGQREFLQQPGIAEAIQITTDAFKRYPNLEPIPLLQVSRSSITFILPDDLWLNDYQSLQILEDLQNLQR